MPTTAQLPLPDFPRVDRRVLGAGHWKIPAERMKMGEEHIVPLSRQAVRILDELKTLTSTSEFLFPNERSSHEPMSENTLLYALYRLGYHRRSTVHGFRSSASTLLNEELEFDADVIERQLAHQERNKVRGAYHRAQYLPQRREMMQKWADFVDELAGKQNVSFQSDPEARSCQPTKVLRQMAS
jgi:integrase